MARTSARNGPDAFAGESLPPAAHALVFYGHANPLTLEHIPLSPLQPGELLVRVTACTICGSDLHTIQGRRNTPLPTILGHEIIGEIAALHADFEYRDVREEPVRPGDRITWAIAASCGDCFYCNAGLPQKCEKLFKYGHESLEKSPRLSGGLAEFCHLARGSQVLRLPKDLPDEAACPANCATATVAAALRAAGSCAGQDVLVQGAGLLGLTACAMAKARGARTVVLCDPNETRLREGLAFGASHLHNPATSPSSAPLLSLGNDGRGFDLILEMSGAGDAIRQGLDLPRLGGRYIWVGSVFPGPALALNPEFVTRRCLTISGVHNYAPQDLASAVDFLSATHTRFPFQKLVAKWFALSAFEDALEFATRNRPVRVGIRP